MTIINKGWIIGGQAGRDDDRNRELADLINYLPGGVICCKNEYSLGLLEYSEGFLELIGYTAKEVEEELHNSFLPLIAPEDCAAVWAEVQTQLQQGDVKEIEYCLRRKDGSLIWVLDRGKLFRRVDGSSCFYCILMDETGSRNAREELRLSLERHRIIMEQTNDIIFEWDGQTQSIRYSHNWEKRFGGSLQNWDGCQCLEGEPNVHPDDGPAFRMADQCGRYFWRRTRVTLQRDEDGKPLKGVGIIVDIDDEKRRTQRLERLAQRDTLTGLYNKGTAQKLVEDWLAGAGISRCAALLIIDIDNFKRVNDTFGHLGGDMMLSDISRALQKLFRSGDIVGRIGGDEFCVFLRDIDGPEIAEQKAGKILEMFGGILAREQGGVISGSVGVAITPADGRDFQMLFQKADMALYHAKKRGKNCYSIYGPGMEPPEPNRALDESPEADAAIPAVLEIVGRELDVSRAYIFEFPEGRSYAVNTFEWCGDGVKPEIDRLQEVPLGDIQVPIDALNAEGIFYARDVVTLPQETRALLERRRIRAMLQCAIKDGERLWGVVGFDKCRSNRMWTQDQIDTLIFIAKSVGVFLLKSRGQEQIRQLKESIRCFQARGNEGHDGIEPGSGPGREEEQVHEG